jgi:uncharacterized protein (UPF0548 family)
LFSLRRPSADGLQRVLESSRDRAPTFGFVGATRSVVSIEGFRFDTYSGVVGHGDADWNTAKKGLRSWAAHAGFGASVTPSDAPLVEGETVVLAATVGPLHIVIPCRIVYVLDEENRFGFAYVTLPGHPECGEEAFMLERRGDDVVFTMSSHSRPAELLAQLGAPASRAVQRRANHAYIEGMRKYVEERCG